MPIRRRRIAALRLAALVCCAAGLLAVVAGTAAAGGASQTYTDPPADSTGGGPEASTTTLSASGSTLTVQVAVPNRTLLSTNDLVAIFFNTDGNETNNDNGSEYAVYGYSTGAQQGELYRYNPTSTQYEFASDIVYSFAGGVLTASFDLASIGSPAVIEISLQTYAGNTLSDAAPDDFGWYPPFDTTSTSDADGDGVPDASDDCMNDPAAFDPNHNGCDGPWPALAKPTLSFRGGRVSGGLKLTSVTLSDVPAGAKVVVRHGNRTQTTTKHGSGPLQIRILVNRLLPLNSTITITITKPNTVGFAGKYRVKTDGIARIAAQCIPAGGGRPRSCGGIDHGS
jgi:hypothetical protein